MGDTPHSIVLQSLLMQLGIRTKAWKIRVLPMHKVEIGQGRWHLCDVCVVSTEQPLRSSLEKPPMLCVEIVSQEDGASALNEKVENYLDAGVKVVWEIDPVRRKAYQAVNGELKKTDMELTVPGTDILVYTTEIFDALNELNPNDFLASAFHNEG